MSKLWILVADSTKARIFTTESAQAPLVELDGLQHKELQSDGQDTNVDASSLAYDLSGHGRHDLEPVSGVKEAEAQHFAREVAEYIENGVEQKRCNRLVIAAAPAFLGMLREKINNRIRSLIRYEYDKNFTQMNAKQIRQLLPERLPMM